jgi:GxxExxY protein
MGYDFEKISSDVIAAAIDVHKTLGPGFIESIYENALVIALQERGIQVEQQVEVPIYFHEKLIGKHRVDLLVNRELLVENKSVDAFEKIHFAIVRSYLRAMQVESALILNFNAVTLQIKRVVQKPHNFSVSFRDFTLSRLDFFNSNHAQPATSHH